MSTRAGSTNARLEHLLPQEAELYRDLVDDSFGSSVRVEQERISFAASGRALSPTPRSLRGLKVTSSSGDESPETHETASLRRPRRRRLAPR